MGCWAIDVQGPVDGWYAVVLGGHCGADILARFAGLPVTLLLEAWRLVLP